MKLTVTVPDLGGFKDVAVIDVLVKPGQAVDVETPLMTVESDKATMDIPSTSAGTVESVAVKPGDKVSTGSAVVVLLVGSEGSNDLTAPRAILRAPEPFGGEPYLDTVPIQPMPAAAPAARVPDSAARVDVTPLRGQARAARLRVRSRSAGRRSRRLYGGVSCSRSRPARRTGRALPDARWCCLDVGCIPSKALLHAARVIEDAQAMSQHGVLFGAPQIDATKLRDWKDSVVGRLTDGLRNLARQRKVAVVQGTASFTSPHELRVDDGGAGRKVSFQQCVIAAGSESVRLPGLPDDPRIIDSTGALELDLPASMLVIGGGIIGLEMATVYAALGVGVSVAELTDGLMPGCDRDLVRPLEKRIAGQYEQFCSGPASRRSSRWTRACV